MTAATTHKTLEKASKADAFAHALRLGDDALILGQRLGELCGHGPQIELDIALTNFSLDYIGQARLFLSHAGDIEDQGRDEDALAFTRDCPDFANCLLVEQPNGDFAQTVVRLFLFAAYRRLLLEALTASVDEQIAAIAAKSVKEVDYHLRFAADWTRRLGGGTDESHARAQAALDALWPWTPELFAADDIDRRLAASGDGADIEALEAPWRERVTDVLGEAGLQPPEDEGARVGGRQGRHTEHLGHILSEMQFLQRAYPGAKW